MKPPYLFLIFVFLSIQAFSQDMPPSTVLGGNPLTIKWKYIDTKAVKVIFPAGNEKEGTRIASAINLISDSAGITVGIKRKHLDLLVQTNQVISNGYVALAPYRSEFYATSFQNFNLLGSITWLDALTFHEYRHGLQFANGRRGLTKFGYFIGGQSTWQLLMVLSVPNWYMEGDAVQTETVLSAAGRGRTPSFFQEQKALLFNNRNYKYIKARNGSFKDLMPNHYPLGYAMLHQVRNEFGPNTWAKVLKDGSSYRSVFYPFSRALKRHTGYTTRKLYYHTYGQLKKDWEEDLKQVELIPTTRITPVYKTVTNYTWPIQLEDGSIVCLKGSYKKIESLVQIKNGKEEKLVTIGITTEGYLSENHQKFAWSEMSTDMRRQNRNYNDIVSYDLATHTKKKITHKTKLYSPQFSAKGDRLVAVKADNQIKSSIVFISVADGSEIESIPNPLNDFLSYPKWTANDESIIYLAKHQSEIAIMKYDLASKTTTELTPWSHNIIGETSLGKDHVYFSASYSGIDNLYAVSFSGDKVIRQISSVKIGAHMPNISQDEKSIIMTQLNYTGQELLKQDVNLDSAKIINLSEPISQPNFRIITTAIERNLVDSVPERTYEVKNYRGLIRGAKLHTWGIVSDLSALGASLRVDNILNDFGAGITTSYNRNEKAMNYSAIIDYSALFLPISLNASANDRNVSIYESAVPIEGDTTNTLKFKETIVGGNIALPLRWIFGAYTTSFRLVGGLNHISTRNYSIDTITIPGSNEYTVVQGGLTFSNTRKRALQNVLPRFGQLLSASIGQSIDNAQVLKYMASGTLYFPGVFANHSLYFTGSYRQEKLSNSYRFVDNFIHARGYSLILGDEEFVVSTNYQLPLFYPDFGFGGLVYFKRMRLNVFCDISQVNRYAVNKTYNQNSAGFEVLFDVVIGNLLPMSIGLRRSFLMDQDYFDKTKTNMAQFYFAGTF